MFFAIKARVLHAQAAPVRGTIYPGAPNVINSVGMAGSGRLELLTPRLIVYYSIQLYFTTL
jgi:hypothetical protein